LDSALQVELQPGTVGGNQLQALATIALQVPASKVKLWQPLTQLPKGKPRELYDLAVMFEPTAQPEQQPGRTGAAAGSCGLAPDSSSSSGSTFIKAPEPEIRSAVVRRIGFRTVELVREPVQAAAQQMLRPEPLVATDRDKARSDTVQQQQQQQQRGQQQQQLPHRGSDVPQSSGHGHNQQQQPGESFFFKINGIPLYAKGANLIPFHVLSTAVTVRGVRDLLQSAVDANMNMIRIWGGGLYQVCVTVDGSVRSTQHSIAAHRLVLRNCSVAACTMHVDGWQPGRAAGNGLNSHLAAACMKVDVFLGHSRLDCHAHAHQSALALAIALRLRLLLRSSD
jgi:hypothetical protein